MRRSLWGFALCAFAFASCLDKAEPADPVHPLVTLYGAKIHSYEGSELTLVGRSAKLAYNRISGDFTASEVLLRFPSRNNPGANLAGPAGNIEVRARWMSGNLPTKQAEATDGVTLRTGGGVLAKGQRAHFDGVTRTATGKGVVDLEGPAFALSARSFVFDFRDETFQFEEDVAGTLGKR